MAEFSTETKPLWTTTREAMGKTWNVELLPDTLPFHEDHPFRHLGASYFHRDYVRINAGLGLQNRDATLLHELLHLASDASNGVLTEKVVETITPALFAFLRGFGLWQEFPWPDREENYTQAQERDG